MAYVKLRENTPTMCSLFCLNNAHPFTHCHPADWLCFIYTSRVSRIFRKTIEDLVSFYFIFLFRYFLLEFMWALSCRAILLLRSNSLFTHALLEWSLNLIRNLAGPESGSWIIRLEQRSASFRQMARKTSHLPNYSLVTWECFRSKINLKIAKVSLKISKF